MRVFVETSDDRSFALRLDTTEGVVHEVLQRARLRTRVSLLDGITETEGYDRVLRDVSGIRRLDDGERAKVIDAFERYVESIPERGVTYRVKDVAGRSGFGIGSAGLPAYTALVEGFDQALDHDVVLSMKQGNVAAPSRVVDDPAVAAAFHHHGHRTAVSQRALQAHADPMLGWTAIAGVVAGRENEFADRVVASAHEYAATVRADHALFVEAFRSGAIPGVAASELTT